MLHRIVAAEQRKVAVAAPTGVAALILGFVYLLGFWSASPGSLPAAPSAESNAAAMPCISCSRIAKKSASAPVALARARV